jgi:hypothetical protein
MEEAMAEHSLFSWTIMVCSWVLLIALNGWSGAHFIADRVAEDYAVYAIHLISGVALIYVLMHMLWFPQRMLGEGTRVQTRAAAAADADLLVDGVILVSEGECRSCKASAPISQNEVGETMSTVLAKIVTAEDLLETIVKVVLKNTQQDIPVLTVV